MNRHLVFKAAVLTVAAVALPSAQPQDKPKVIPSFSTHAAPAFWVECRNLTNRDISLAGAIGRWRIDGVEPPPAGMGSSLPPTQIAPGATYRGIMALLQPSSGGSGGFSAVLGAMSTLTTQHTLTPGRHTLAVECLGAWSDDFEFYWLPARTTLVTRTAPGQPDHVRSYLGFSRPVIAEDRLNDLQRPRSGAS